MSARPASEIPAESLVICRLSHAGSAPEIGGRSLPSPACSGKRSGKGESGWWRGCLLLCAGLEGIYRAINITHCFLYGSPHGPLGKSHRKYSMAFKTGWGLFFSTFTSKALRRLRVLKGKRALSTCFCTFLAQCSPCVVSQSQMNKTARGAARAGREGCAVTGRCSHSAQPHGVSPPTLRDSQALHVHRSPASMKGHRHPKPYHCSVVEVTQCPGLLPSPRSGSAARRSAARKSLAAARIKPDETMWGEGWGRGGQSPSICGSEPHGRDAALCLGALACRWVAQGDAQQEKLFSFCLFSPLSCETDVSWPCHLIRF